MFKRLLLAGAASTLLVSTAQAADIVEEPAMFDWTGAYIGLQAGYAWDKTPVNEDRSAGLFLGGADIDVDSLDPDGFVGGLHAGYLFQQDSLVFGLEGDIEYSDISGSTDFVASGTDEADINYDIDWLGSVRLRAGFAMDRALIYATGGLAVGDVELEGEDALGGVSLADETDSQTEWGWTVGGGVEYAIADDLSVRLEYRYTDLGKSEVRFTDIAGNFVDNEVRNDFHAVRGGVSWHF